MLGNCEKMVLIPPTPNEWSQQFCYYNNYSLSQPRHFCKACKRYWTRGGTLRNVPVGGGCRKNKRVKRPAAASAIDGASSSSAPPDAPSQPHMDISASTSNHMSPLFYGSDVRSLPFPRFNIPRVSSETVSGYDLQPQMNALGLGFSSGILSNDGGNHDYRNGFNPAKQIQDLSSYNSIFGSSANSTTTSPTMASLLSSSFQQQKFVNGGIKDTRPPNHLQGFGPFEGLQIMGNTEAGISMKEVKVEDRQNRSDWNQMDQVGLSDPTLYWNATSIGVWNDPGNIGSSVTSLI
ncbi:hypothetical protein FH972_000506 [Carpinus fangiana]|uniref:Dof zinc finger protein n=1 Tax=Carpinus fangiana TaxID=176857 RepID=A0A5N6Q997_9ROSI|nr:hypothetical protein FH972_000506 [Carpinus fangiana]